MQTKPLVTLIMSMYNGESYLEKCLESIVSQSYSNIEVLLFDDGSTHLPHPSLQRRQHYVHLFSLSFDPDTHTS